MIIRQVTCAVLYAAVLCIASISVFAWDDTGHKISGYIAWRHMTPEVRERVHKILLSAPEDSTIGTYFMHYGARSDEAKKREYFMFMTTWADIIRSNAFPNRVKNYHHSNWHYDDKFWRVVGGQIEYLPPPEDGGVALQRMKAYDEMIRGNAKDSEKAVAIGWLMHIFGDIHQPLHTSARVTDLEPKGDQGGNLFLLTPQGTPRDKQENLHWFWDSIVPRNMPNSKSECDGVYIEPIAEKFIKKYPYEKMKGRLAMGKYDEWAADSLRVAQTEVFSADLKRWEMPSEKYKKKALAIAEERLSLAGYRLGELFNQAFGTPPPSPVAEVPCKVIRKVMYPVTHSASVKQTLEIGLLDLCPTNMAARPMIGFMIGGKPVMKEYDVVKVFKTEAEARKYAADNKITDVSF